MKPSSIRPCVCPIDRQQQRRVAGLLLRTPQTGDIDQQQAPALSSNGAAARLSAANAGRHVDNGRIGG